MRVASGLSATVKETERLAARSPELERVLEAERGRWFAGGGGKRKGAGAVHTGEKVEIRRVSVGLPTGDAVELESRAERGALSAP